MRRALAGLLMAAALVLGGWLAIQSSWAPTTGRACLLALCSHDCGLVAGAMLCLIVTGSRKERKTGRARRPRGPQRRFQAADEEMLAKKRKGLKGANTRP